MALNDPIPVVADDPINILKNNINLDLAYNINSNFLAPILEDMGISSNYYDIINGFINFQTTQVKNDILNMH